VEKLKTH